MSTEGASKPWSLRRRLLLVIVGASTVLWLGCLAIVTLIAWDETKDVFDDALEESAYMIMAASERSNRVLTPQLAAGGSGRKVDMQYQIVAEGRVIQRSGGAPAQPFVSGFKDEHGFADPHAEGRRWRVFVARDDRRGFEVQVGQQYGKRIDILEELAEALWLPVLSFLVLLALVCWLLTGRVLKPLRQTAAAIAAKTPDDLALVPMGGQPRELLPIVAALNAVLGRLDNALQAERRFTADAAHELRTPLAGLHMHVQLLQRQHPQLAASFGKLRGDIARTTALVDGLLTLARLDPLAAAQIQRQALALCPLLERLREQHATLAAERAMTLSVRCDLAWVHAEPQMLEIMLRNLIDNAMRYSPQGSRVEVEAGRHDGHDRIVVRDNGAGVDEASRQRLTERFFRVLGQGQGGSGLGLSIVKRIADLHGITLAFGSGLDGQGLGVTLILPDAPDPASA